MDMPFSKKMQLSTFNWLLNIILAGIIYANAEAGRLLGIQGLPLHFSAIWPATGFALTALLLFGRQATPGIFVGNLVYNFLHLYLAGTSLLGPAIAAVAISTGSTVQALVGNYVMRRFCTTGYFKTVKDIGVFLAGGGFFVCMIAATVGVSTMYLYGPLSLDAIPFTWLTFWFGDTLGVFVLTPLLITWSLGSPVRQMANMGKELLAMLIALVVISLIFIYVPHYPSAFLFLPYCMWVGYRTGFQGATAAVFLISGMMLVATTFRHGNFVFAYPQDALLVAAMHIEGLVLTALFAAAVHKETE